MERTRLSGGARLPRARRSRRAASHLFRAISFSCLSPSSSRIRTTSVAPVSRHHCNCSSCLRQDWSHNCHTSSRPSSRWGATETRGA